MADPRFRSADEAEHFAARMMAAIPGTDGYKVYIGGKLAGVFPDERSARAFMVRAAPPSGGQEET